ncbi:hypothetical protein Tco_0701685, partial [Tanacetum coccineum]
EERFRAVDEPDEEPAQNEPEPEPEHQGEGEEIDMECAIQMSLESFQAQIQAHVGKALTEPSAQPLDDMSANIVHDSPSLADAETCARSDKTSSGGDTEAHMDEDQAGPDPGISHVALVGPIPEPTHDDFMADLYPKVQESLKFPVDEHVILEDPLPSSSVPPLSTPVIDLSPPKPASSATQALIFIATTNTTTTTLPPPPQQQSIPKLELVERVVALEKKFSDLEQTNKNLDNTTRNLGSRVYTLELRDLPHKIDEVVRENVKKQSGPHAEQPVDEIPIPDSTNISDSEDTDSTHLPKSKQRPEWLKPIPDDERPATPEPSCFIPPSHIPDAENNWANALATTYQAPAENSLLEKTGDMRTFMHWYC